MKISCQCVHNSKKQNKNIKKTIKKTFIIILVGDSSVILTLTNCEKTHELHIEISELGKEIDIIFWFCFIFNQTAIDWNHKK